MIDDFGVERDVAGLVDNDQPSARDLARFGIQAVDVVRLGQADDVAGSSEPAPSRRPRVG